MLHELSKITYFDLLAASCLKIWELDSDAKKELYRKYSIQHLKYNCLANETLNIQEIAIKRIVLNTDLDHQRGYRLINQMQTLEDGCLLAMATLALIDQNLDIYENLDTMLSDCPITDENNNILGVSPFFKLFDALNPESAKVWGSIIPIIKCSWEKESCRNMRTASEDPLSILKHYAWIPPEGKYHINNLLYTGSFEAQDVFNVSASPITCKPSFGLKLNDNKRNFRIEYSETAETQEDDRLNSIFQSIIKEKVDVAIFPEILGTSNCICNIRRLLQENWTEPIPKLTFLPTREYCPNTDNEMFVNELAVLDEDGNIIFRYYKQHPFEYDKKTCDGSGNIVTDKYFEPIRANHELFLIHFPNVGRIGVVICSDIFDDDLKGFLFKHLRVSLLLHPSYSGGLDQLERAYSIAIENSSDIILCNTCAAFAEEGIMEGDTCNWVIPPEISTDKCKYYAYGHSGRTVVTSSSKCDTNKCKGCFYVFKIPFSYNSTIEHPVFLKIDDS